VRLSPANLLLSFLIEPQVDQQPSEPGLEGAGSVERGDALERSQERILNQVIGIVCVLHQAPGYQPGARQVTPDQLVERTGVARLNSEEDLALVVDFGGFSQDRRPSAHRVQFLC
jgi:hypothetical protein